MTYSDIAEMTESGSLIRRLYAAAAQEGQIPPETWVSDHRWQLCSAPGWADAWASAQASGNLDPGADPGVITDAIILSEVQAEIAG